MGTPTEVFHRTVLVNNPGHQRRSAKNKVLHVFFVPGNPGTLHFYLAFLDALAHALAEAAPASPSLAPYAAICVHGCGHACHHLETTAAVQTAANAAGRQQRRCVGWGLEHQTHHASAFIDETMDARASYEPVGGGLWDSDIMVVGHSIGAYIALQLLQESRTLRSRCRHVLLLMPFVSWSRLPAAHRTKLSSFVMLHPLSQHVAEVLAKPLVRLPRNVKRSLVAFATGHADDVVSAVADGLANDRVVTTVLTMGVEEVVQSRAHERRTHEFLVELDRRHDVDLFLCYTDDDVWAPLEDADAFARSLSFGGTTVRVEPGLTHAFSLSATNARRMVSIIQDHFVQGRERGRHGVIRSRL